jgi:recombination protein RecA
MTAKKAEKNDSGRAKAAALAIEQIRDRFGDGAIMRFGESKQFKVDSVSTGCLSLDLALGVGGVPRGRIIEIYGPEASGKTTLAQHIVAEVQKAGGSAAFVDAEHALDPDYAEKIGVDTNSMLISQPDTGEQALEIVETLVRSNAVDVIVIDSVAALTPKAEIEGDMGDSHMGLQARLMSQALRKLAGIVSKTNCVVIFINQTRMKIGIVFGNPETTTGGMALKFYSSVRIEVRRAAQIKQGDRVIGNRVKVKVVKNKVAAPFRTTELDIAKRFATHTEWLPLFTSCNRNFAINKTTKKRWCGECPKCAFVFAMLAPFVSKTELVNTFGKNLFADETLLPLYQELLGLKNFKPFECVGTPNEVRAAFTLASRNAEYTNDTIMRFVTEHGTLADEQTIAAVLTPSTEHAIPKDFQSYLHE